jgi:hypothetical protein
VEIGKVDNELRSLRQLRPASLLNRRNTLHAQLEQNLFRLEDAARQVTLFNDTLLPRSR